MSLRLEGLCCTLRMPNVGFTFAMSAAARRRSPPSLRSTKRMRSKKAVFDVKLFLESNGLGRKVARFRNKEIVFSQGDPAKSVIYIQEGGVKLTVVNRNGKEGVVEILEPGDFFGVESFGEQT